MLTPNVCVATPKRITGRASLRYWFNNPCVARYWYERYNDGLIILVLQGIGMRGIMILVLQQMSLMILVLQGIGLRGIMILVLQQMSL